MLQTGQDHSQPLPELPALVQGEALRLVAGQDCGGGRESVGLHDEKGEREIRDSRQEAKLRVEEEEGEVQEAKKEILLCRTGGVIWWGGY